MEQKKDNDIFSLLGVNPESAREKAFTRGLLSTIFQAASLAGPQARPTSGLQALGQVGLAGLEGYESSMDRTLREILMNQQLSDLGQKRKRETAIQQALQLPTTQEQVNALRALGAYDVLGQMATAEKGVRQSGMLRQPGETSAENPFLIYAESPVPGVAKLAKQYQKSYESGAIDDEKSTARLGELGRMEESALRESRAEAERRSAREEARLKGEKPTAEQMKAGTLAGRLNKALTDLTKIATENPQALKPEVVPELLQSGVVSWIPGSEMVASKVASEDRLRAEAAQLDALDAALTLGTGAAYTREQLRGYAKAYFPQVGDTTKVIEEKNSRFKTLVELARKQAGPAYFEVGGQGSSGSIGDIRQRFNLETPR